MAHTVFVTGWCSFSTRSYDHKTSTNFYKLVIILCSCAYHNVFWVLHVEAWRTSTNPIAPRFLQDQIFWKLAIIYDLRCCLPRTEMTGSPKNLWFPEVSYILTWGLQGFIQLCLEIFLDFFVLWSNSEDSWTCDVQESSEFDHKTKKSRKISKHSWINPCKSQVNIHFVSTNLIFLGDRSKTVRENQYARIEKNEDFHQKDKKTGFRASHSSGQRQPTEWLYRLGIRSPHSPVTIKHCSRVQYSCFYSLRVSQTLGSRIIDGGSIQGQWHCDRSIV